MELPSNHALRQYIQNNRGITPPPWMLETYENKVNFVKEWNRLVDAQTPGKEKIAASIADILEMSYSEMLEQRKKKNDN